MNRLLINKTNSIFLEYPHYFVHLVYVSWNHYAIFCWNIHENIDTIKIHYITKITLTVESLKFSTISLLTENNAKQQEKLFLKNSFLHFFMYLGAYVISLYFFINIYALHWCYIGAYSIEIISIYFFWISLLYQSYSNKSYYNENSILPVL